MIVDGRMMRWLRAGLGDAAALTKKAGFELAMAAGLTPGQDDYSRFVILGRGRTGSNLLRTSIASHSNAICFGELFNNRTRVSGRINWGGYPGYRSRDRKLVALRERNAVEFLDRAVYGRMPDRISAVGFKLFYYHAQERGWERVWDHLRELDVRAVHLMRRNLLESQVSAMIAERTGRWMSRSREHHAPPEPFHLPYESCVRFFERSQRLHAEHASCFERTLEIYYEDLVADYHEQTRIVQQFLGLPHRVLSSPLKKQTTAPLSEIIENYAELERKFAGTGWSRFFEPGLVHEPRTSDGF